MDEAEYDALLKANSTIPGFLTYFVMTYFPELLYAGFSYDLAASGQLQEARRIYEKVFQYQVTTRAFSHFGDINEENQLQQGEGGEEAVLNELDGITKRACSILHCASEYPRVAKELTLFEGAGRAFGWILKYSSKAELFPGNQALHWDAQCYYEQLLRAEISLCLLATRDTESPLDSVELIQPFVEPASPEVRSTSPLRTPPRFTLGVRPKTVSVKVKHGVKGVTTRKVRMANRASVARGQRRSANIKRRRGMGSTRRMSMEALG